MSAGWSKVRVFSPNGIELAEISAGTIRSWVLNDVGRCTFKINIYDALSGGVNQFCNPTYLGYGNLILIEHKPSVNADGSTNGVLPPWVGVILPPRSWKYGEVSITAYSAEHLLFFRCTPQPWNVSGTPGSIFQQLIQYANDTSYNPQNYPIRLGEIYLGGEITTRQMKVSAWEEIKALIQASGGEWNVTPYVDNSNRLSLIANYYLKQGVDVGRAFSNVDIESASPIYIEQGDIFNWIRGYSQYASSGNVNFAAVGDFDLIAQEGLLGSNQSFTGIAGAYSAVGQEAIKAASANFLAANKFPTRTLAPNMLDLGNDFSYVRVGNTWLVQLDTVGFTQGKLGLSGKVRITAMEYNDMTNQVRLAAVMQ